jgi:hypothetical protein
VTSKAQLLIFDTSDFHHLLDHYPNLKEHIERKYVDEAMDKDFGQTEIEEDDQ